MDLKCAVCKRADIKLLRCSKCKMTYYCSKEHQQSDWKTHKNVCGKMEKRREELENKDPLIDEDINDIMSQHNIFLSNFEKDKKEFGLENAKTLTSAFKLIDSYISMYKLEPTEKLINEIFSICESKGSGSEWNIKAIQARGFLRYKQHRFKECLEDFIQLKKMLGPSAPLNENMGHVYNTLGMLKEAEQSFEEALFLMNLPNAHPYSSSNKGGVLLGLGIVKERQEKPKEALKFMNEALEFYEKKYNGAPSSLTAKTLMSIGKTHFKMGELENAEKAFARAVVLFQKTCGDDTPLTADALLEHAKTLQKLGRTEDALSEIKKSLSLYLKFDNNSIYVPIVNEIVSLIIEWDKK